MKKKVFVLMIVFGMLAALSVSAVSAKSNGAIECVLDITWDDHDGTGNQTWLFRSQWGD